MTSTDESPLPVETYRWGWQFYHLADVSGELRAQVSPEFIEFMKDYIVNRISDAAPRRDPSLVEGLMNRPVYPRDR